MKKLYSMLVFCVAFAWVSAQNITATADTLYIPTPLDSLDKKAHNTITNTASTAKTFKWTREVQAITPNCVTYVCDPKNCYLPSVSSKQFDLPAGGSGSLDVHLRNDDASALPCAVVRIHIEEVTNASNAIDLLYYYNDCKLILDNKEPFKATLKVYPNPVADFFYLENDYQASSLKVVSRDGREVKNFIASEGQSYSIADLPVGQYFVLVYGKNGEAVRAIEVVKQ